MLQELGESGIKIKIDDTKEHVSSGTPNSPKTSDTTSLEKGETIITIIKPSINILKHYLKITKGDRMVYNATQQKYTFFDNAYFFGFGNLHHRDSFFEERGVQNPSFGER
jgi:hypothetical protein